MSALTDTRRLNRFHVARTLEFRVRGQPPDHVASSRQRGFVDRRPVDQPSRHGVCRAGAFKVLSCPRTTPVLEPDRPDASWIEPLFPSKH